MSEELENCLLCSSWNIHKDGFAELTLNLAEPHGVTICHDCGLRFLNPRPTAKEYREFYSTGQGTILKVYPMVKDYYCQMDSSRLPEQRKKLDILTKARARGDLLEIGACSGAFLNEARVRGFQVQGIEPGEANCRLAWEKYRLQLIRTTVEEYDFPCDSFDVIFSSHAFEHFLEPMMIAKKVTRWLKRGGMLMVEVPNQFDTFSQIRKRWLGQVHKMDRSFLSIHHTVFFSRKSLVTLATLSGCRVIDIRNVHYFKLPNPLLDPRPAISRVLENFIGGGGWIELLARKN